MFLVEFGWCKTGGRLDIVIQEAFARLTELCQLEADFMKVLLLFSEDTAVRIMTIHKSKGLEFDSVVILGIEQEPFWGAIEEERSAFFVGISRAKRRLVLTVAEKRPRPDGHGGRWDEARTLHPEFLQYATVAINS
jgi:superfamily I DNA/RNA helicase